MDSLPRELPGEEHHYVAPEHLGVGCNCWAQGTDAANGADKMNEAEVVK